MGNARGITMNRIVFVIIFLFVFSVGSFAQADHNNFRNYKKFSSLKKALKSRENVKYLNLSGKKLVEFPDEIYELDSLEVLILNNNNITVIPDRISELRNLKYLYLLFNPIERIPDTIVELKKLERLFFINSKIREDEADYFRQKMPKCLILLEFGS